MNDCEEIMGIVRDIYSEYNGIQESDQNTAEQMMNRMKEIIKQIYIPWKLVNIVVK